MSTSRWLAIRLDFIVATYATCLTFAFIPLSQSEKFQSLLQLSVGSVGVVLSATSNMLGTLSWGIRQSSEAENNFTSVERVIDYANLPPEEKSSDEITKKIVFNRKESRACINRILSPVTSANHQINQGGSVKFENVVFNYYTGLLNDIYSGKV